MLFFSKKDKPADRESYAAVEKHLHKFFCDNEITIFHELESPDFHLDIYAIKPNKVRDYIIVMTNGISSVPLKTPDQKTSPYIELCILLPGTWELKGDNWKKPKNYWVIELLKNAGRFPFHNDAWLSYGHTIQEDTLFYGTEFSSVLLIESPSLPLPFQKIKYGKNTINLLTLFPLYAEELEFIQKNGLETLFMMFDQENIRDIITIHRKNVCKHTV